MLYNIETVEVKSKSQLDLCLKIRYDVFTIEQNVPESLDVDEYDSLESHCRHLLICIDGKAIGTGRIKRFEKEGCAKLQRIAVLKEYRLKDIGSKLVSSLESLAKSLGYKSTVLDSQITARGFYEKLGYKAACEELFYDAGILHVRMAKQIT